MHVAEVSENQERENMTEVVSEKIVAKIYYPNEENTSTQNFKQKSGPYMGKTQTTPEHIIIQFLKITKTNLKVKKRQGK